MRRCGNCARWARDQRRGLCRACYIWSWRHGWQPRPWWAIGRGVTPGRCRVCGVARVPHTPEQYRRHRKIYMQQWLARRAVGG